MVGISFAIRKSFLDAKGIRFINSGLEDWEMIAACRGAGARILVIPRVAYYIKH